MLELLLIPIVPLFGSALVYFLCSRNKRMHSLSGWLATAASFVSFFLTLQVFAALNSGGAEAVTAHFWRWFAVDSFQVDFGLRFDRLAAVMTLVVTGVGSLIHLYAIGYMAEDENKPRFFSYLNLFLFSMLLLVLGDNMLLMFVGWEGVGLCSYLLIGFWFSEMENARAGQKAFIVNRIGDAGFLLGMFTLILATGTISFTELEIVCAEADKAILGLAGILLFIGACGKSAQIPLYIWLPDAMAGPTPVSALIHAATMVTAGIYMIARLGFLYLLAPSEVLTVVLVIGCLTAFLAATIALVQNDIKKVLAYSTVSQLGYMFMAMGVGAFSNGIFHVVTHAFFKACLFMAAGSVIIGCHHEQDMRQYGGLWKKMPFTFAAYFAATLAIAGLPFTSGFYSKDGILWTVYSAEGPINNIILFGYPLNQVCWALGALTALLTAFYMCRSLMMTFFGQYRGHAHPHESPWVVWVPLLILAAFSLAFGMLKGDALIHYLDNWTRADMKGGHHALLENPLYVTLEYLSMAIAILGFTIGVLFYSVLRKVPKMLADNLSAIHKFLEDKWRIDELYDAIVVRPLFGVSAFLFKSIDRAIIDTSVNSTGHFVIANGEVARLFHNGRLNIYALFMFAGLLVLTVFWLLV